MKRTILQFGRVPTPLWHVVLVIWSLRKCRWTFVTVGNFFGKESMVVARRVCDAATTVPARTSCLQVRLTIRKQKKALQPRNSRFPLYCTRLCEFLIFFDLLFFDVAFFVVVAFIFYILFLSLSELIWRCFPALHWLPTGTFRWKLHLSKLWPGSMPMIAQYGLVGSVFQFYRSFPL